MFINSSSGCDRLSRPRLCRDVQAGRRVRAARTPQAPRSMLEAHLRRPPSATVSRCPPCWCRARPTPSSPWPSPTRPRRRSRANGAAVDVDWSQANTTAATWNPAAYRHASRPRSTAISRATGRRHRPGLPRRRPHRRRRLHGRGPSRCGARKRDAYTGLENDAERPIAADRAANRASPTPPAPARPPSRALPGFGGSQRPRPALGVRRRGLARLPRPVRGGSNRHRGDERPADHRITRPSRVHVKSTSDDAVLFAKVYDVNRRRYPAAALPAGHARSGSKGAGRARAWRSRGQAIDHQIDKGRRLRLVLASTDLGYASPAGPGDVHGLS